MSEGKEELTWLEQVTSFRYLLPLLSLLWETDAILFTATIVVRFVRAILPLFLILLPRLIIDAVSAVHAHRAQLSHVWALVLVEFALGLLNELAAHLNSVLDALFGERFTSYVAMRLMKHAACVDLAAFEDAEFYDKLERVRSQSSGRVMLLGSLLGVFQELATLCTLIISVTIVSPWLLALLVLSTVPALIGEAKFSKLSYLAFYRRTSKRRALEYVRLLATWAESAKEVRTFGLSSYLLQRYELYADEIYFENKALSLRRSWAGWGLGVVSAVGYYLGYVQILRKLILGRVTVGGFIFLVGVFARSRLSAERVFAQLSLIIEQALLLRDLCEVFHVPVQRSSPMMLPFPAPVTRGFEFENVSFSYPTCSRKALDNVSLAIRPGELVALIGENGSGKTTLVKLLCRLYEPTSGRICLDGVELANYDLDELRAQISVLYQDFVKYDLTLRENIRLGSPDVDLLDDDIYRSTSGFGMRELVSKLTAGFDQLLGTRFKGGVDLSGGEWQKVALGRTLARKAELYIFDEPSSSLDLKAEHNLLAQLSKLVANKMVLLISHRLSAARVADRIVILEEGRITEEGTHADLLRLGGRYADLWNLDAGKELVADGAQ